MGLTVGPFYLDANVFIDGVEGQRQSALKLFRLIGRYEISVVTSEMTLSELLVKPLELRREDIALGYTRLLMDSSPIETVPVSRLILVRSAEIRARVGGKLPDAIHVATALQAGCKTIVSTDKRLPLLEGLKRSSVDDLELDEMP